MGGLFLGAQWESSAGPVFLGLALCGAWVLGARGGALRARLWVAPLALLTLLAALSVQRKSEPPCSTSGSFEGSARVESLRYLAGEARLRLRVIDGHLQGSVLRTAEGLRLEGRAPLDSAPPVRSVVHVRGELRPWRELRNPSPHPRLSSRSPSRCWVRWRDEEQPVVLGRSTPHAWLDGVRARIRKHLRGFTSEDASAVARALVLGEGGALGYERRKTIAAVGLAHLFAVSGLHIALVSGSLVAALRWVLRGCAVRFDARRLGALLGVPLTLFHAAFAGGSPSAWRAALTAGLTWSLVAMGRRPAPAAITAFAALLLSAPEPEMALRPAFLLSIVATSAILSAPAVPRGAFARRLRLASVVSARTLLATTPMVWWWFGGVPLIGWVTNIVVLPFGTWVVVPLAHLAALSVLAPPIAAPLGLALQLAVDALLAACEAFTPLAVARRLPPLDPSQGVVVAAACALLLRATSWRQRLFVVLAAVGLWLGAEHALRVREQPRDSLRLTFADVGQGDAALIDLPDGRLALVDAGRGDPHPSGRELRALLAARRRSRIDLLVITHGHPDHYGGLEGLLRELDVGEIWLNGQLLVEAKDRSFETLLNRALASRTRLRFVSELCGTTHVFGDAELEVIWPCPRYDPGLELNDNSLTLRIGYGRSSFLLTGDLEHEAERQLVERGKVQPVDLLKVAHHGSATSSRKAFVEAARPAVAVISCGKGNRYGHPDAGVLERLRAVGAEVLRTDHGGGVIVSSDGERLSVRR